MAMTEIAVGVITRAHGVRGEVTVDLRTDEPERRFTPGAVLRAEPGSGRNRAAADLTFTVVRTREHQGRWLVTFAEIADRTAAEAVRGIRLVAEVPDDETPTGEDEFYDRQLIGLAVVVEGSTEPVGTVTSVLHLPAQDVFEIDTNDGVRLVPFVSDLVPEVDLSAGRIVVSDVAGLLTDADEPTADEPPADQPTTADPTTADQPADEPAPGSRS
jgi:16S rRNA processing protein RimM